MPIIEDFSDYDSFPDENHIHYLSLEAPRNPQLYLNREHPQVVEVLNNTGYTGGPPRLETYSMTTLSTRSGRSSCYRQHAIRAQTPANQSTAGRKTYWTSS